MCLMLVSVVSLMCGLVVGVCWIRFCLLSVSYVSGVLGLWHRTSRALGTAGLCGEVVSAVSWGLGFG